MKLGRDIPDKAYSQLIEQIGESYEYGRRSAQKAVHHEILVTYWNIGKHIVEFEQSGDTKAEYGKGLLLMMSRDLKERYGKGFSRSNLTYMRLLYANYPKCETLSHKLSWSHYFELLKIGDTVERSFYEKQSILEKWSIRELKRQKDSSLFQRLSLSKNKKEILALSKEGHNPKYDFDIVKAVSYTHLRAHETDSYLVCRLLLE